MKFGQQFEFHKIPEWYAEYYEYQRFKTLTKEFKDRVKCKMILFMFIAGKSNKLRGIYQFTQKKIVIPMKLFKVDKNDTNTITIR